jgi:hypothetical protein
MYKTVVKVSKKTKWTPKQWKSRLNTDRTQVENMVCKYCAHSIDMNSRVALIAQHIKHINATKHKNLKEKQIQRNGHQLSLEEIAIQAKEMQQKLKVLTMT